MFNFSQGLEVSAASFESNLWSGHQDVGPAIQAAINDVSQAGGGIVEIPAGVWDIGAPIQLASNVELVGVGKGATLMPTASDNGSVLLLNGYNVHDDLIQNITFDGGGSNFANPNPVIEITIGDNIVFNDITVENSRGIAVLIQGGVQNSGVENSTFVNIGNYWKTTGSANDRVQAVVFCCGTGNTNNFADYNKFSDIGLDALQLSNQNGFSAIGNTFKLQDNQHKLLNTSTYPAAIFAMDDTNALISGNNIYNAQGCGIDAPGLVDSSITNNVISGCYAAGIGLFEDYSGQTQASNVIVSGNSLTNNVQWSKSPFDGQITIYNGSPSNITLSNNNIIQTTKTKYATYAVEVLDASVQGLSTSANSSFSTQLVTYINSTGN